MPTQVIQLRITIGPPLHQGIIMLMSHPPEKVVKNNYSSLPNARYLYLGVYVHEGTAFQEHVRCCSISWKHPHHVGSQCYGNPVEGTTTSGKLPFLAQALPMPSQELRLSPCDWQRCCGRSAVTVPARTHGRLSKLRFLVGSIV